MTRYKTEVNAITGEMIVRPYTDEENAQADIDEASESGRQGNTPEPREPSTTPEP